MDIKAKIRAQAKKLNPIDELMFRKMAEDPMFCEEILRVILGDPAISRFDIFKGNRALYHVERVVRETGEVVDNGFEEIYVNASARDGSDVAELMDVFTENDAYSGKFPYTSNRKYQLKNTEGGQKIMCEIMEKIAMEEREEGRAEGMIEGKSNAIRQIVLTMHANGLNASLIASMTGLPEEQVKDLVID